MPTAVKVLGQSAPSATTNTDVYTVPSGGQAVLSSIAICNRGAAGTFRVAIRPDGAALANQHYIVYDAPIDANETLFVAQGVTIDAADVVTVYCSHGNMSVNVFGEETT